MTTTITPQTHPRLSKAFEQEAGFAKDLNGGETINVNGRPMNIGVWNMIVSKRDLSLWTKLGMKPHRGWKVSDCKRYFGLTGSGEKLMNAFNELVAEVDSIIK